MSYINQLISTYRNKGIVVDANLWILLLVGSYNKATISDFKKTQKYTAIDFDYLYQFLSYFKIITTPNILTEVVNHTETFNKQTNGQLFLNLRRFAELHFESYIPSLKAMDNVYHKFGLSDSVINNLSNEGYLILTDDFPLYGYLSSIGNPVINFNHIRMEYLLK